MKQLSICLILAVLGFMCAWPVIAFFGFAQPPDERSLAGANSVAHTVGWVKEGPCTTPQLVAGPFDLHRKYKSMEGPWVSARFRVGDLIASGNGDLPESNVRFVENDNLPPAMNSTSKSAESLASLEEPDNLIRTNLQKRELYWLKGFKIEVLDENGRVMPSAEFICHVNVDVDKSQRNKLFPEGERCSIERLLTITQGQTELRLPEGCAVPVASDEQWRISLQAANRVSDEHRRIRHRATFHFIKDTDLMYPVTALTVRVPFVSVIVDSAYEKAYARERKTHPHCDVTMRGVNAPNNVIGGLHRDDDGRVISGHWVVPPGQHEYAAVINEQDPTFADKERILRFGWVHIHPCCRKAALRLCNGTTKEEVCSSNIKTVARNKGLLIESIETLKVGNGVRFKKGGHYELVGAYDNTTGGALDSMVSVGLFFEDPDFKRPSWANPDKTTAYCGITSNSCPVRRRDYTAVPSFQTKTDGPLLTGPKAVQIVTSAGKLNAVLEPKYAPKAATQMFKLFTLNAFANTTIYRYEPNFVLQVSPAYDKAPGKPELTSAQLNLLRKIPLEVAAQQNSKVRHRRFMLSLARYDGDPDSGQSSFSILLGSAPHLDQKYSIFGALQEDAETMATLARMQDMWSKEHPYIISSTKL